MDPYQTPEAKIESADLEVEKKRGIWLSIFIVLMIIGNPLTAISYLSNPDMMVVYLPGATPAIVMTLGVLALLNTVLAVGVWLWKRWGVYGFYATTVIAFFINIYIGLGAVSIFGFIGVLILYLLTRKRWQHFS